MSLLGMLFPRSAPKPAPFTDLSAFIDHLRQADATEVAGYPTNDAVNFPATPPLTDSAFFPSPTDILMFYGLQLDAPDAVYTERLHVTNLHPLTASAGIEHRLFLTVADRLSRVHTALPHIIVTHKPSKTGDYTQEAFDEAQLTASQYESFPLKV